RYIRPYQRNAKGPSCSATGSNCGWVSIGREGRGGLSPCVKIVVRLYETRSLPRSFGLPPSRRFQEASMPDNRRSRIITQGIPRSPNRAMLRAVGFNDGDFEKPIVGIANGHSTMNPCNAGLQTLADRAESAVREAGGMPQTFGVITVTDGISMGTEGMKYSLVSHEVIADSIETAT